MMERERGSGPPEIAPTGQKATAKAAASSPYSMRVWYFTGRAGLFFVAAELATVCDNPKSPEGALRDKRLTSFFPVAGETPWFRCVFDLLRLYFRKITGWTRVGLL
ncbi:hypothetical protein EVAR_42076_1 [Eumeta japonica]|uniref:Uncharacterized protein n=1 Tax=Eumeta variegata TaxID=151549 RepID=A0A4C1XY60_EUMVA|nr:hypothetical protein EVAR_42076_1 [Eumeta japonica]